MKLTAIVITKNEGATISGCLKHLSFADERIVIDAESTDNTVAIARADGAKVFVQPWSGYGAQKNFGIRQASHDWVLFIDADEQVTAELATEIKTAVASGAKQFYWLTIVTVFLGQPLWHLYGHNPRLFNKHAGVWTQTLVHEQVENLHTKTTIRLGDQYSAVIKQPLLHHSHATIASYLEKMQRYASLDAQEMAKTDKHRSGRLVKPYVFLPVYLYVRQFAKMYVYRHGFLDGYAGFMWCALSAYYEFVMAKKYLTLKNNSSV